MAMLFDAVTDAARDLALDVGPVKSFHDRFGPVDVMLLTSRGYVCANQHQAAETIDVAVYRGGDLIAWGSTRDPGAVATVLHRWNADTPLEDLVTAAAFLEVFDELDASREIQALWRWLLKYGDEYLQPLAHAAHAEAALGELLPFVSHGSLGLLKGRVARQTHQITFYPTQDPAKWVLGIHRDIGRGANGQDYHQFDAQPLADAIAQAAAAASEYC